MKDLVPYSIFPVALVCIAASAEFLCKVYVYPFKENAT
jgi:hypothetical protein